MAKKNIIPAVIHVDETTPHLRVIFVPLTRSGRSIGERRDRRQENAQDAREIS